MRIIYMGTPEFAVLPLTRLHEAGHEILAVYTQPDRQKGRGRKIVFSPVKERAVELNLPVEQPVRLRDSENVERIRNLHPDLIVVAAYGQILSEDILSLPKYGCINLHASLLPKYRGASPVEAAILAGDAKTGITVMQMDRGLDTGDILMQRGLPIEKKDTTETLTEKLSRLGADMAVEISGKIQQGKVTKTPQDDTASSYAGKIQKEDGRTDFSEEAVMIDRKIRAYTPWPGVSSTLQGRNLRILEAEVEDDSPERSANPFRPVPGEIVQVTRKDFTVQCGKGRLKIQKIQPAGKKAMDVSAFLNGTRIETGSRFTK